MTDMATVAPHAVAEPASLHARNTMSSNGSGASSSIAGSSSRELFQGLFKDVGMQAMAMESIMRLVCGKVDKLEYWLTDISFGMNELDLKLRNIAHNIEGTAANVDETTAKKRWSEPDEQDVAAKIPPSVVRKVGPKKKQMRMSGMVAGILDELTALPEANSSSSSSHHHHHHSPQHKDKRDKKPRKEGGGASSSNSTPREPDIPNSLPSIMAVAKTKVKTPHRAKNKDKGKEKDQEKETTRKETIEIGENKDMPAEPQNAVSSQPVAESLSARPLDGKANRAVLETAAPQLTSPESSPIAGSDITIAQSSDIDEPAAPQPTSPEPSPIAGSDITTTQSSDTDGTPPEHVDDTAVNSRSSVENDPSLPENDRQQTSSIADSRDDQQQESARSQVDSTPDDIMTRALNEPVNDTTDVKAADQQYSAELVVSHGDLQDEEVSTPKLKADTELDNSPDELSRSYPTTARSDIPAELSPYSHVVEQMKDDTVVSLEHQSLSEPELPITNTPTEVLASRNEEELDTDTLVEVHAANNDSPRSSALPKHEEREEEVTAIVVPHTHVDTIGDSQPTTAKGTAEDDDIASAPAAQIALGKPEPVKLLDPLPPTEPHTVVHQNQPYPAPIVNVPSHAENAQSAIMNLDRPVVTGQDLPPLSVPSTATPTVIRVVVSPKALRRLSTKRLRRGSTAERKQAAEQSTKSGTTFLSSPSKRSNHKLSTRRLLERQPSSKNKSQKRINGSPAETALPAGSSMESVKPQTDLQIDSNESVLTVLDASPRLNRSDARLKDPNVGSDGGSAGESESESENDNDSDMGSGSVSRSRSESDSGSDESVIDLGGSGTASSRRTGGSSAQHTYAESNMAAAMSRTLTALNKLEDENLLTAEETAELKERTNKKWFQLRTHIKEKHKKDMTNILLKRKKNVFTVSNRLELLEEKSRELYSTMKVFTSDLKGKVDTATFEGMRRHVNDVQASLQVLDDRIASGNTPAMHRVKELTKELEQLRAYFQNQLALSTEHCDANRSHTTTLIEEQWQQVLEIEKTIHERITALSVEFDDKLRHIPDHSEAIEVIRRLIRKKADLKQLKELEARLVGQDESEDCLVRCLSCHKEVTVTANEAFTEDSEIDSPYLKRVNPGPSSGKVYRSNTPLNAHVMAASDSAPAFATSSSNDCIPTASTPTARQLKNVAKPPPLSFVHVSASRVHLSPDRPISAPASAQKKKLQSRTLTPSFPGSE